MTAKVICFVLHGWMKKAPALFVLLRKNMKYLQQNVSNSCSFHENQPVPVIH